MELASGDDFRVGQIGIHPSRLRWLRVERGLWLYREVTVIHVDARPADTRSAQALLDGFRRNSLRDPGAKGFEVLQEIDHPNHFTLFEKWIDEKAYEAHNLARHTRHFRDQLQPMLASPFDERIHTELGGVQ